MGFLMIYDPSYLVSIVGLRDSLIFGNSNMEANAAPNMDDSGLLPACSYQTLV